MYTRCVQFCRLQLQAKHLDKNSGLLDDTIKGLHFRFSPFSDFARSYCWTDTTFNPIYFIFWSIFLKSLSSLTLTESPIPGMPVVTNFKLSSTISKSFSYSSFLRLVLCTSLKDCVVQFFHPLLSPELLGEALQKPKTVCSQLYQESNSC